MVFANFQCLSILEEKQSKKQPTLRWIKTAQIIFWLWPLAILNIVKLFSLEELNIISQSIKKNEK